MRKLIILVASIAMIAIGVPVAAYADAPSNEQLHQMIIELEGKLKNAQDEAREAKKELAETKGESADEGNEALGAQKVDLEATSEKSYLKMTSADGSFEYKIDGRIMLDTGSVSNSEDENKLYSNTEFRRLRLALKTKMYDVWAGEFDVDLADEEVDIKDMWISYNGLSHTIFKLGNHKPNFCMNEVTTSRWITFMERSMVSDAFSPGRRIGFSANNWGKYYFAGFSVFGDELDEDKEYASEAEQSEHYGYSTRLVGRPLVSDDNSTILHIGFNYMNHEPAKSDGDVYKIKVRPEAHFVDYKFLDTGKIDAVDDIDTYGLELAAKWKKVSFQTEYMKSEINRSGGNEEPEFDGWYAMVSYFITDDQRPYNLDDAEFGPIVPTGDWGAWEVALRYSNLDLNDASAGVEGGSADAITIALNWYVNNNVMIKLNYIKVDYDHNADMDGDVAGNDDLDIVGVRFQYLF